MFKHTDETLGHVYHWSYLLFEDEMITLGLGRKGSGSLQGVQDYIGLDFNAPPVHAVHIQLYFVGQYPFLGIGKYQAQ